MGLGAELSYQFRKLTGLAKADRIISDIFRIDNKALCFAMAERGKNGRYTVTCIFGQDDDHYLNEAQVVTTLFNPIVSKGAIRPGDLGDNLSLTQAYMRLEFFGEILKGLQDRNVQRISWAFPHHVLKALNYPHGGDRPTPMYQIYTSQYIRHQEQPIARKAVEGGPEYGNIVNRALERARAFALMLPSPQIAGRMENEMINRGLGEDAVAEISPQKRPTGTLRRQRPPRPDYRA